MENKHIDKIVAPYATTVGRGHHILSSSGTSRQTPLLPVIVREDSQAQ